MVALKVLFMALATVMIVAACANPTVAATANAIESPVWTLFQAQTRVETRLPEVGVQSPRDAHDFNMDAVRAAEAQRLTGRDWVRWALRWNREQYQRSQRDIRIETRTGTRITRQGNTTLITPYVSTSSYGNGPVLLYNPFVQPIKEAL